MGRTKTWGVLAVVLAMVALAPAGTLWAQNESEKPPQTDEKPKTQPGGKISGSLGLTFVNKGYHKATQWNPNKYTFNKGGSVDFSQEDFVKMLGGTSFSEGASLTFDKGAVDKFLKNFCKDGDVSGSLGGKVKSSSGGKVVIDVTGNVKTHWPEGKGQKDVEAKLSGTFTFESGKGVTEVSVKGDPTVTGSWNWGGGEMELEGEATVEVKNK